MSFFILIAQPRQVAEYQAVLDYASDMGYTLQSVEHRQRDNLKMQRYKDVGFLQVLDQLFNFCTDGDSDFALINWITPGIRNCTKVGGVTFSSFQGFQGNGTNAGLNTNFAPATHGVHFQQNDACFAAYCGNNINEAGALVGAFDAATTNGVFLRPRNPDGQITYRVNHGTATEVASDLDAIGMYLVNRTAASGSGATNLYKNGYLAGSGTVASTGMTSASIHLLCNNNAGTLAGFSNRNIKMYAIGSSAVSASYDLFDIENKFLANV